MAKDDPTFDKLKKALGSGTPATVQGTINPQSILNAQAQQTAAKNTQLVQQNNNALYPVQGASEYADALNHGALQGQQQGAATASGILQGNSAAGFNNANNANAAGQSALGNLGNYYGGLVASNNQSVGNYQQQVAPYYQPTPGMSYTNISGDPYGMGLQNQALNNFSGMMGGSMDISAAQVGSVAQAQAALAQAQMYYSNPADVNRQISSYNDLSGAGGGSLDYWAKQYQSNPADYAAQNTALQDLRGISKGSLDWSSQAALAHPDAQSVINQEAQYNQLNADAMGFLDQHSLAAEARVSPETLAKQQQGMDKLWAMTDPSISAPERMMMEQARRDQEQTNRASRGQVMGDLQSRGFGGAGAQMTDMLGAQEQEGQERTLADLGAQANAANRATSALGMYVDASGQIRSQEFDEAFSRAAAGDAMAVSNANRRLQATGMAADQANLMRQASFDEAYKKGLAADQASASNQSTRLSGAGMAASQANAIRQANDNVGMFNTNQVNTAQANNQSTRLSGMGMAAQQSNAIRSANDTVGMGNADRQTSVNMQNSVNLTNTSQFNAGQTNQVNMFNTGEQNRVGIANQDTRAKGAMAYGDEANAIRSANDVINMHNSNNQVLVDTNNMMHGEREARRITDLAGSEQGIIQGVNRDNGVLMSDFTGKTLGENDLAAGRTQTALNSSSNNAIGDYNLTKDIANAYRWTGSDAMNRSTQIAGLQGDNARFEAQTNLNNNELAMAGPKMEIQNKAYDDALKALQQPDDGGLLSFLPKVF